MRSRPDLRERSPSLRIEVVDPATAPPMAAADVGRGRRDRGPGPRASVVCRGLWFDRFFLITVPSVHPDPRWRIGAALQVQAEVLARRNPGLRRRQCCSPRRTGWAGRISPSPAARTAPPGTGGWRARARSSWRARWLVQPVWTRRPAGPPGHRATRVARARGTCPWRRPTWRTWPRSATRAVLGATRERATAATRRAVEDVGRISRTLRKVPQALRRKLAARRKAA